jgi:hypothetical protein
MESLSLHTIFLEQSKQYNPSKDDLSKFNYIGNVGSMGATNSSEWYEKMSSMMLNELEVLKSQKMGEGIQYCKPCELSVTGTIKGDIESEKICVNKGLYYKKWDCPEGYGTYSVMMKEYGTTDWKVLYEMTKNLPTTKYVDPITSAAEWLKDPHNVLTVFEIGVVFIPIIGPFLSAGFGLANAKLYWDEGKKEDAVLSAFFSILPGLGAVGGKIAGKIGKEGLETLSQKIIKQGLRDEVLKGIRNPKWFVENINKIQKNFTPKEITLLKDVANSRKYLEKITGDMAKTNPNKFKKLLNDTKSVKTYLEKTAKSSSEFSKLKGLSSNVETGINLGGIAGGLSAFPLKHKLKPGVREKVEKTGYSFDDLKLSFGSTGTTEDNLLMVQALNDGWLPGEEVPEKYQTITFKKKMKEFEDGLKYYSKTVEKGVSKNNIDDINQYLNQ